MEFGNIRSPPMTKFEKEYLIELVNKYKHKVENMQTDAVSTREKNKGWEDISREFCSMQNVTKQSGEQLKKCWSNLKQRSRQAKNKQWRYAKGTGGGCPSSPPDPLFEKVDAVVPHINKRYSSIYDDDGYGAKTICSGAEQSERREYCRLSI
ncbi:hypothetical protein L9F63_005513 [Diploptera punctata]|uniref:Regulatory protein zeste n=1 Tax=Diploptera punctata TaxID=6984 RepID=A0AAD8E6F2_DIPPU|nr:hypothetical protein L9F63_005513 [Diploptera punctata]